jgi:hypothetical protein
MRKGVTRVDRQWREDGKERALEVLLGEDALLQAELLWLQKANALALELGL